MNTVFLCFFNNMQRIVQPKARTQCVCAAPINVRAYLHDHVLKVKSAVGMFLSGGFVRAKLPFPLLFPLLPPLLKRNTLQVVHLNSDVILIFPYLFNICRLFILNVYK